MQFTAIGPSLHGEIIQYGNSRSTPIDHLTILRTACWIHAGVSGSPHAILKIDIFYLSVGKTTERQQNGATADSDATCTINAFHSVSLQCRQILHASQETAQSGVFVYNIRLACGKYGSLVRSDYVKTQATRHRR